MEEKQIFDKESTFCDLKKIITTVVDAEVQSKKKSRELKQQTTTAMAFWTT